MALIPVRPPQLAFERRRGEVERAASVQGQTFKLTYFLELSGAGEATVDINFPVKFQERPGISHGAELGANSPIVAGNYPMHSVTVARWVYDPESVHVYYTGASLLLAITGSSEQTSILHFHAEGKALVAPV